MQAEVQHLNINDRIGAAIDHFRIRARLTQGELAVMAGIGQSDISRITRGKQDLTVSRLHDIAKALCVSEWELFVFSDRMTFGRVTASRKDAPP